MGAPCSPSRLSLGHESKSDPDYAQPDLSMLEVLGSDEAADKREGVRPGHGSTVVLSCNASANNIGDEGVEGMARAFLLAGAAAIVGTLVVRRRHEYISAHGADVPAPRGCGRRAAGGLEAANALGRLSCHGRKHAPPPRRRLPSASLAAHTHHPAPHFVIRSTVWSILPAS